MKLLEFAGSTSEILDKCAFTVTPVRLPLTTDSCCSQLIILKVKVTFYGKYK